MQHDPDAPNGMTEYLIAMTAQELRTRGDKRLSLNFATWGRLFEPRTLRCRWAQRAQRRLAQVLSPYFQITLAARLQREVRPGVGAALDRRPGRRGPALGRAAVRDRRGLPAAPAVRAMSGDRLAGGARTGTPGPRQARRRRVRATRADRDGDRERRRRRDLRHHGSGRGAGLRAGGRDLVPAGGRRRRGDGALLRRAGGDAAGRGQHVLLRLRRVRAVPGVVHRLGPAARVPALVLDGRGRVERLRRQPPRTPSAWPGELAGRAPGRRVYRAADAAAHGRLRGRTRRSSRSSWSCWCW